MTATCKYEAKGEITPDHNRGGRQDNHSKSAPLPLHRCKLKGLVGGQGSNLTRSPHPLLAHNSKALHLLPPRQGLPLWDQVLAEVEPSRPWCFGAWVVEGYCCRIFSHSGTAPWWGCSAAYWRTSAHRGGQA